MEKLEIPKIREIHKAKASKDVNASIKHEQRIEFHVEPVENIDDSKYSKKYLDWVSQIIDGDKFGVFKHLLKPPFETVDFTEGLFTELKKVFYARDRFISHTFKNPELEKDFDIYLEQIGDGSFWKNKGFDAFRNSICSVLIVDINETQTGEAPEPYYYLLPVENVINYKFNENSEFEYIVFEKGGHVFAFDSLYYRRFKVIDGELYLEVENAHDLNYCPASLFWADKYNKHSEINRRSVLTNALSKLDWLLTLHQFKKHESLYAGFPIDIIYEQNCNYQDDQGNVCENGKIEKNIRKGNSDEFERVSEPCPQCSGTNKLLGAGTTLLAPARGHKDDPDLLQGLNRISADVKSLEWIQGEIAKTEKIITWRVIGYSPEQAKEAMNELQIAGNFESRENILSHVKTNFETIHSFAVNTIGLLRYGNENYLGSVVSYGKEFFFRSLGFISEQLKASRENGMPIFEIVTTNNQYIKSKYRDNPEMIERQTILSYLEPYQGYTVEELLRLPGVDPFKVDIKLNLNEYIQTFELEYMNIVNFMQFVDFKQKIKFISTKINDYAKQSQNESRANRGGNGGIEISPTT